MLSAPSECLLRSADLFDAGRWLLVNPDAAIFAKLPSNVQGLHQYFDTYLLAQKNGSQRQHFGLTLPPEAAQEAVFDGVVVYASKAKQHTRQLLHYAASVLVNDGQLLLVGENKAGVKSMAKLMQPWASAYRKLDAARHCSLFQGLKQADATRLDYAQETSEYQIEVKGQTLAVTSLPGVFSHNELDAGTQLLLENLPNINKGRVLDFACGSGVIGAYLQTTQPEIELVCSDINANALFCSERTLAANNCPGQVLASDGLRQIQGEFDAIVTNPPFHTGVRTDHSVTRQFILDAVKHLEPGGKLILVANRFLPYPEQLQKQFGNVKTIAETSKFKLYCAVKR